MVKKTLATDVGMSTYRKLYHDTDTGKFHEEHRHIGAKGNSSEITKDDVLRKLSMEPHPAHFRRELNEKNLSKHVPEYISHDPIYANSQKNKGGKE